MWLLDGILWDSARQSESDAMGPREPMHMPLNRYAAMMAAAKTRREEGHTSRQGALASLARPFTFYDADVERVRAKRAAASAPPPKPSYAPFKANPIPATTLEVRSQLPTGGLTLKFKCNAYVLAKPGVIRAKIPQRMAPRGTIEWDTSASGLTCKS